MLKEEIGTTTESAQPQVSSFEIPFFPDYLARKNGLGSSVHMLAHKISGRRDVFESKHRQSQ
jgi:hypothetical protein